MLAVRWYLSYDLSYRDVEELLAERGMHVDHVTIHRWVQLSTLILAAVVHCGWYVYRAVDEYGLSGDRRGLTLRSGRTAALLRRLPLRVK
jgi:transposase, IS6 family